MSNLIQYDESAPVNFNLVKEYFVDAMAREKYITKEEAEYIKRSYALVVVRRNWLGRIISNLIFREGTKDEYKIAVVKMV
jgi:hypothetical protein